MSTPLWAHDETDAHVTGSCQPTSAQLRAATKLVVSTKKGLARFADLNAALAAGYAVLRQLRAAPEPALQVSARSSTQAGRADLRPERSTDLCGHDLHAVDVVMRCPARRRVRARAGHRGRALRRSATLVLHRHPSPRYEQHHWSSAWTVLRTDRSALGCSRVMTSVPEGAEELWQRVALLVVPEPHAPRAADPDRLPGRRGAAAEGLSPRQREYPTMHAAQTIRSERDDCHLYGRSPTSVGSWTLWLFRVSVSATLQS